MHAEELYLKHIHCSNHIAKASAVTKITNSHLTHERINCCVLYLHARLNDHYNKIMYER